MNAINKLLKSNTNIAVIGETGCGKTRLMKEIVPYLVSNGKKVLVIDPLGEYKKLINRLCGTYTTYGKKINFESNLVAISLWKINIVNKFKEFSKAVTKIISDAEKAGVEIILIDEGNILFNQCIDLSNVSITIIMSAYVQNIRFGSIGSDFSNIFPYALLMEPYEMLQSDYNFLDKLYNINNGIKKAIPPNSRCYGLIVQKGGPIEMIKNI